MSNFFGHKNDDDFTNDYRDMNVGNNTNIDTNNDGNNESHSNGYRDILHKLTNIQIDSNSSNDNIATVMNSNNSNNLNEMNNSNFNEMNNNVNGMNPNSGLSGMYDNGNSLGGNNNISNDPIGKGNNLDTSSDRYYNDFISINNNFHPSNTSNNNFNNNSNNQYSNYNSGGMNYNQNTNNHPTFQSSSGLVNFMMKLSTGLAKTIITIVVDICFLVILVYGLTCLPVVMKYNPIVVDSESIEVKYKKGTLLYYKEVESGEDIVEGDIIVCSTSDNSTLSVRKVNQVLVTRKKENEEDFDEEVIVTGDEDFEEGELVYQYGVGSEISPTMVSFENISGKVADIYIPFLGHFVSFISSHISVLYLLGAIVIIDYILGSVFRFIRDKVLKKKR